MLTAHNLECVRGERRLFTALNFTVQPGTLLAVRGVNGSGIGRYKGVHGFRELSHARSVFVSNPDAIR